jgi:hypothetical protein
MCDGALGAYSVAYVVHVGGAQPPPGLGRPATRARTTARRATRAGRTIPDSGPRAASTPGPPPARARRGPTGDADADNTYNMMIPINCMNVITHYEDGTPALGLGPLTKVNVQRSTPRFGLSRGRTWCSH